jgi:hypothetical protein
VDILKIKVEFFFQTNTAILNVLWSLTCGRKMHAQQQEFQVEKNRFMSQWLRVFTCARRWEIVGAGRFGSIF